MRPFLLLLVLCAGGNDLLAATISITNLPQLVFPGLRPVELRVQNHLDQTNALALKGKVFQVSGSIAAPLPDGETNRQIRLFPQQTSLETFYFNFPEVRVTTLCQIRWADSNGSIGQTVVRVVPSDLLKSLNKLAGPGAIGVFDPGDRLVPQLKKFAVEYQSVDADEVSSFEKRLLILVAGSKGLAAEEILRQANASAGRRPTLLVGLNSTGVPGLSILRENGKHLGMLQSPELNHDPASAAGHHALVSAVEQLMGRP